MEAVQDPKASVDSDWQEVLAAAKPAEQTRAAQVDSDWQEVMQAAGKAHGPVSVGEKIAAGAKATASKAITSLEDVAGGALGLVPGLRGVGDKLESLGAPSALEQDPVVEAAMTPEQRMTTVGAGELAGGFAPALIPGIGQSRAALALAFALQGGEAARRQNEQHPEASPLARIANKLGQAGIGALAGYGPAGALTREGGGLLATAGREALGGAAVGGLQDLGTQLVEKGTVEPDRPIDLKQSLESAAALALAGGLVGTAKHLGELAAREPTKTLPKPGTTTERPADEPVPKPVVLDEAASAAFENARRSSNAPNAEPVEPRPGAQADLDALLRKAGRTPVWALHPEGERLSFQGETSKDAKHIVLDSALPDSEAVSVAFGHELGQHVVETRNPEDAKAWTELAAKYAPEALKAAHVDFLGRVEQAMAPWKAATEQVKVANAQLREARLGSDPAAIEQARARAAAATDLAKTAWDQSPKIRDPAKIAASEVPAYLKEDLGTLAYVGREHPEVLARIRLNNYSLWTKIVDALKKTLRAFKLTDSLTALEKDLKFLEDRGAKQPKGMSMEVAIDLANKLNEHVEKLTVPEEMRSQPFATRERVDFAKQWEAHQAENEQRLQTMREAGATEDEIAAERKQFEEDRATAKEQRQQMLASAAERQQVGTAVFRHHEHVALAKAREAEEARQHPEMPVPERTGAQDEGRKAIKAGESARRAAESDKQKALNELERDIQKKGARSTEGGRFSLKRNPQEDTPEFKRWFGDSKVVDEKGKPLVVYHGSGTSITRFRPEFTGKGSDALGTGYYFTTDEAEAAHYTTKKQLVGENYAPKFGGEDNPTVHETYLSIKNPVSYETKAKLTPKQARSIIEMSPIVDERLQDFVDTGDETRAQLITKAARAYTSDQGTIFPALWKIGLDFFPNDHAAWAKAVREATGYDGMTQAHGNERHWVAWFPEQIKSATGNSGAFDPKNPDIRYSLNRPDSVAISEGQEKLEGVKPDGRNLIIDVGRAFDARAEKRGYKLDPSDYSPESAKAMHDRMLPELRKALRDNSNAIGWYAKTVREAMDTVATAHPEIATSPDADFIFKAILAVTSNGTDVEQNFVNAKKVYEGYKATGRIPSDLPMGGMRADSIGRGLRSIQALIDQRGIDGARALMLREATVGELMKEGFDIKGENVGTTVRGSAILGPKIGSFFSNLMGHFDSLTADLWWSRTWNRLNGNLVATDQSAEKASRQSFREAIQAAPEEALGGRNRGRLMSRADATDSFAAKLQEAYAKGNYKDKTDLNIKANTLSKILAGQLQSDPRNGSEREFMRGVTRDLQKTLEEQGLGRIDIADIQAVMWYYEKGLWDTLGAVNERARESDYAKVARRIFGLDEPTAGSGGYLGTGDGGSAGGAVGEPGAGSRSLPRLTPERLQRIAAGAEEALNDPAAREAFPVRTPSMGEKSSAFQIGVGQEQRRGLETVPLEHMAAQAQAEIEADRAGTEKRLRAKIESGKPLDDWEHIATAQIAEDKTAKMLRSPTPENFREATRWTWMDREAGTKAGRALASRRRRGERYGLDAITAAIAEPSRYLKQKMREMQDRIDRELNPEVRFSLLKQMDDLMEQAARQNAAAVTALGHRGLDPALVSADYFKDPYTFHLSARTIAEAKSAGVERAWNWLMQYRLVALLSAPTTHLANTLGNAAHLIYEGPTKKIAEALVGTVLRDKNAASLGEVASYMRAYLPGLAHAARNFMQAMRTDRPSFESELERRGVLKPGDATSRLDIEGHGSGIGGKLGRVLRFPSLTLLTAEDEFFKTLAAHTEAVSQAYRMTGGDQARMQAMLDMPESPAWEAGLEHARKATFQDKPNQIEEPFAHWALSSINKGREALAIGPVKPLYLVLPFTSTPFRILQRGLAVPFHPLVVLNKALRGKYGATHPGALARDTGTLGLSLGIAFAISELVHKRDEEGQDGLPAITGSRPWSPAEKAMQARTAPSYSVRIGDEYYSYGRLDPAATAIGALVDAAEAYRVAVHSKDENAASAAFLRLVSSGYDMTKDKTFLRTLGDVFEALRAPEGAKAARLVRDTLVTPMVPNILRRGLGAGEEAQTSDNVRPHEGESAWPAALRSIPEQLAPGVTGAPTLRYDVWGREVKANGRSGLARFLSPTPLTGRVQDIADLDAFLMRYNDRVDRGELPPDAKKWYPDAPEPTYLDSKGMKHFFSDEQFARLQREGGQKAFDMASHLELHNPPTEQDVDNIKRMVTAARRLTRIEISKEAQ